MLLSQEVKFVFQKKVVCSTSKLWLFGKDTGMKII